MPAILVVPSSDCDIANLSTPTISVVSSPYHVDLVALILVNSTASASASSLCSLADIVSTSFMLLMEPREEASTSVYVPGNPPCFSCGPLMGLIATVAAHKAAGSRSNNDKAKIAVEARLWWTRDVPIISDIIMEYFACSFYAPI